MAAEHPRTLRVLIVDDNPLDRADAKAALLNGCSRPYHFIEACSAEEGLRLCALLPLPDGLVLDLGLPDAGEREVLSRLQRDDDQRLRVPVVVLTGAVKQGLSQAALRAGAHDYVGKAWLRPETLTQAVDNAMERLSLARAAQVQRHLVDAARIRTPYLAGENCQMQEARGKRQEARGKRQEARGKRQEASRLKSLFMASMSHELRTPLNAIIGFAELSQSGAVPVDAPQHALFLGHIGSSGRHLLQLINDVLDQAKAEAGKVEFFPEPLNLRRLVKDLSDSLHPQIQQKQLLLSTDIEPALDDLVLDALRLKQVLYNFLSNAVKFTPAGGRIAVRALAQGAGHVRLEVEDSGIGIAEADLSRLFTDYQQLDTGHAKRHAGTGLGLALTRRLVQAQHGGVGVRSTPGLGSVFHIVLNLQHGSDAARHGGVVVDRRATPRGPPVPLPQRRPEAAGR